MLRLIEGIRECAKYLRAASVSIVSVPFTAVAFSAPFSALSMGACIRRKFMDLGQMLHHLQLNFTTTSSTCIIGCGPDTHLACAAVWALACAVMSCCSRSDPRRYSIYHNMTNLFDSRRICFFSCHGCFLALDTLCVVQDLQFTGPSHMIWK